MSVLECATLCYLLSKFVTGSPIEANAKHAGIKLLMVEQQVPYMEALKRFEDMLKIMARGD